MSEFSSTTSADSGLNLRFYLSDYHHLLKRYWFPLFIVPLLLLAAVAFYALKGTQYYSTSASAFMDPSFGQRIQTESIRKNETLRDDEQALFSMEEAICSDAMILRVLKKLELMDDPSFLPKKIKQRLDNDEPVTDTRIVHAVRRRYSASLKNATRTLNVYVEDTDPERAVEIAKTFISEFVLFLHEERVSSEIELKNNLVAQATKVKDRAIAAEKSLNSFRSKHKDFFVEQDSDLFSKEMSEISTELNRTTAELIRVESLHRGLSQISAESNPIEILNLAQGQVAIDFDEVLATRGEALVLFNDVKQRFSPSHGEYRSAQSQFLSIDRSVKVHAQEVKNSIQTQFVLLTNQKRALQAEMASKRNKFGSYKSAGAEFRGLQAAVEREWQQYDQINERILNLSAEADLSPNLATPFGDPLVPFKTVKKYIITAAAGAFLGSVGWIILVAGFLLVRGLPITCPRQVSDLFNVPIAATLGRRERQGAEELSSLPLLTGSSKVLHLTSVDESKGGAEKVCKMVAEAYRNQGLGVTVVQVTENPELNSYQFADPGIDSFEVKPSQIQVRKLRVKIRDYLHKDPNRTIIIDSTGIKYPETKLALAAVANSTAVLVKKNGVSREKAQNWFHRFTKQAGNVVAIYYDNSFRLQKPVTALPQNSSAMSEVEKSGEAEDVSLQLQGQA